MKFKYRTRTADIVLGVGQTKNYLLPPMSGGAADRTDKRPLLAAHCSLFTVHCSKESHQNETPISNI